MMWWKWVLWAVVILIALAGGAWDWIDAHPALMGGLALVWWVHSELERLRKDMDKLRQANDALSDEVDRLRNPGNYDQDGW